MIPQMDIGPILAESHPLYLDLIDNRIRPGREMQPEAVQGYILRVGIYAVASALRRVNVAEIAYHFWNLWIRVVVFDVSDDSRIRPFISRGFIEPVRVASTYLIITITRHNL